MEDLLLAIDSGTTSTRALLFDLSGQIVASAQYAITQHFPQPGWVEHDAEETWALTDRAIREVVAQAKGRIAGIGITNQRETIVFWSRRTGKVLAPAIVWQDRRSAPLCEDLQEKGYEGRVQEITGLILDPYFSGTKIDWALKNWPAVREAAQSGDLALGTIESWILWKLTNGAQHLTDASNASRTMLMDLRTGQWSTEMAELLGVPLSALPAIAPTAGLLAETTAYGAPMFIAGMAGDQQAATIGQGCLKPGMAKCTYGTGIFLLANAGQQPPHSQHRLIATWLSSNPRQYALEGSVFTGGNAIKWLRDELGLLESAAQSESLAQSVPDSNGVRFVPAFNGLGAPYWNPHARGMLTGLSGGTSRAHIVRATLEAMSEQTADLLQAFAADGVAPTSLKVDGGMAANNWLCQDIADATGLAVERPRTTETTALGAAMLAATGVGLFQSLEEAAAKMSHADRRFEPMISNEQRQKRRAQWKLAVNQVLAGV